MKENNEETKEDNSVYFEVEVETLNKINKPKLYAFKGVEVDTKTGRIVTYECSYALKGSS